MVTKIKGTKGSHGTNGSHPGPGGNGEDKSFTQNGAIGLDSMSYEVTGGAGGVGGNGTTGNGAAGGNGGNANITLNGNIFNNPATTTLTVSMTAQGGDGGLGGTGAVGFNPGPQGNGGNATVNINGNILQPNKTMGNITLEGIAIGGQGTRDGNASATLSGNVVQGNASNVTLTALAMSNDPNDSTLHDGDNNFGTKTATLSGNVVQGAITSVTLQADAKYSNGTATLSGNIVQDSATSGTVTLEATGQHIDIENNKVTVGKNQELDLTINQLDPAYDTLIKGNEFTGAGANNTFVFTDNGFSGTNTPSLSPTPDTIVIDLSNNSFMFNGKNNKLKNFDNVTVQGNNDPTIIGNNNANTLTGGGADDILSGLGGNDHLNGSGGNDLLTGGTGNDAIDGGDGLFDTAAYSGTFAQYTIAPAAGPLGRTVTDGTPGRDGVDTVTNVEYLQFTDGVYDVAAGTFHPNTAVNHAPAGADNTVTTNEDTAYTFAAADFGFSDAGDAPANNFQAVKITTIPANGVLKDNGVTVNAGDTVLVSHITANQLVFTPNADFHGSPSFTFQVQDDGGTVGGGIDTDQTPNTMTITVNSVNDAPAGTNNTVATNEDTPYTFAASDFGFSDTHDSNNFQAVKITTVPANGLLKDNGVTVNAGDTVLVSHITANQLVFTPNADFHGSPSFTFQVQDDGGTAFGGQDTDQTPNTMTITVNSVNDAPAGTDNSFNMQTNTTHTFTAAEFGFSDIHDSNNFQAVKFTTVPAGGTLKDGATVINAGDTVLVSHIMANQLVYSPGAGFGAGFGTFTFQVQDDGGTAFGGVDLDQSPNTFTVNVTNTLNHAPAGTDNTVTTNEDNSYTFLASDFGFSDAGDAPPNNLQAVKITTLPANGTLYNGPTQVLLGETISVSDINSGFLHFTPNADFHGSPSFTFQVQDDGGTAGGGIDTDQTPNTMTITVNSVNDAPAGANNTVTTDEDMPYTFAVSDFGFSDIHDSNNFQAVKITTVPANGTLKNGATTINAGDTVLVSDIVANQLVFTPNADFHGSPSFTFQVQDDGGTLFGGVDTDQTPNTMTITVNSVNDAPAGTNNTVNLLEDGAHTFTLAEFGFTDPNDSPADPFQAVQITTVPLNGTLTDNGNPVNAGDTVLASHIAGNQLVFTPDANFNGNSTFAFQVQDGGGTANGGQDTDQTANLMTLNIAAVNDAPSGTDNTINMASNTNHVFTAAEFGFTDPTDAPSNNLLAVEITTLPAGGTLTNNGNPVNAGDFVSVADINLGNLVFTPAANAFGPGYGTFTFQVQDDGGTANGGVDIDPSANTMTVDVTPALIVGNQPGDFTTIQAAINAANPGDTILIRAGVYHENVVVNKDGLTLQALSGPGTVTLEGNFSNANGFGNVDGAQSGIATWLQTRTQAQGYIDNADNGFTVAANGVTLKNLTVNDFYNAVTVSGPSVSGLNLDGVTTQSSMFGFSKLATTALDGATINNSTFQDEYIGAAFLNDISNGSGLDATDTTITNSNFSNIDAKGVYMETAQGDTLLDGLTMNNVGQYGAVPTWGADGKHGNGIDINLKYHDYGNSTLTIENFHLTDTGLSNGQGIPPGTSNQAGAIVIEGRDDPGSYNTIPADVSGMTVVVQNGTIDGTTSIGVRSGEFKPNPADNVTGPAVEVDNVTITGTTVSTLDNHTESLMTVNGTTGDDILRSAMMPGSTGPMSLFGLGGNDTLQGGLGDDTLNGGQGNDTLMASGGTDVLNGAGNNDTADFSPATNGVTVSLSATGFQNQGDFGLVKVLNVENLIGSGFADLLTGETGNNTLQGMGGNDILVATTGKDTLDGGAGNDTADFSGFGGGVNVNLGAAGFQTFETTNQVKLISIENLIGGGGNDTLKGDGNNNILVGGGGDDIINGNGGTLDIFYGGQGNDILTGTNLTTTDVAYYTGAEKLNNATVYTITGSLGANGVTVNGPDGSDTLNRINRVKFLSPSHVSDTDNNGYGDLVYQDSTTGTINVVTDSNGPAVMSTLSGSPAANWRAVGTGQFNPDGAGANARKSGILLQDNGTGDMEVITGVSGISSTTTALSSPTGTFTGFTALTAADFNGDAGSDILMWNAGTQTAEIVFLNTNPNEAVGTVDAITAVTGGPSGGSWAPVASGDFNGDGKSDILWQNGVGGAVEITLMNGAAVTNTDTVALNTSPGYTAVATGDFDNDGKSDIVFATGGPGSAAEIWTMNGDSMTNSFTLLAPTSGASGAGTFTLTGAEDVNNDGYSDLLWRNTVNGDVVATELTAGNNVLSTVNMTAPASSFHLVASSGGG